ncbi:class I SAM-dependent methyltransferase [uncultured Roseobacter sp.]|uniref:class I SAM-dependent methyltransferase n=1 Tax=uncultured Roseobacter sp. TaxID=114847 RepID=UPI0026253C39|nr:class I SAM-dependent methyltransferase [uncultured Roseobacter sp.]
MQALYDKYPELRTVERHGRHRLGVRKAVLRHAPKHSIGAEIGVFTGLFADVLAEEIPSKCIYLVDPWAKLHGSHFPNWGSYTAQISLSTQAAKEAAIWRAETADSRCIVIEDFGAHWLQTHEKPFLGWAYLDANHSFQAVIEDLREIERCLLPNGTIMGDDMWLSDEGEISEVYLAVREFCKSANFDLVHADQHGQWAVRRTDYIDQLSSPQRREYTNAPPSSQQPNDKE